MVGQGHYIREIQLGIKNLLQHKLRSALTMLGMVFGVGSVIAMLAVGEGASQEALEQIRRLGSNNIIISTQKPIEQQSQVTTRSFMSIYGLLYEDELRISESFPHVVRTVAVKINRQISRLGEQAMDMRVLGTTPEWFDLVKRPVIAGRTLKKADLDNQANTVILTEYGSRRLLVNNNTIGQQIKLGGDYFEVIGIVQSDSGQGSGVQVPDQQIDAYIPINVMRSRFGDMITQSTAGSRSRELVELHQIIVEVDDIRHVEATAAAITTMLQRFHKKRGLQCRGTAGLTTAG